MESSWTKQPVASAPEESWAKESAQLKLKCSDVSDLVDKIIPKLDAQLNAVEETSRKIDDLLTSKKQEWTDYEMLTKLHSSPEMKLRENAVMKEITNCCTERILITKQLGELDAHRNRLLAMKMQAIEYQKN